MTGTGIADDPAPSRGELSKRRTRRSLVDAAQRLIAHGDMGRASIQSITDLADVGFGSFYNHFSSKAELEDAALSDAFARYDRWLDARVDHDANPVDQLLTRIRLTGRLSADEPELYLILAHNAGDRSGGVSGLAPTGVTAVRAAVAAAAPPDVAADVLVIALCSVFAAAIRAGAQLPSDKHPELAESLAVIAERMLAAPR